MSSMSTQRALPNELIEAILLQLPASPDSKESVRALCRFGEASSRFLYISRSSHIWHSHYVAQWKRCHPGREEIRKRSTNGDWWQMYAARSQADSMALDLLDSIITTPQEQRDSIAHEFASLGYDVWQALSRQTTKVRYLEILDEHTQRPIRLTTQGLTLQYWAHEVLGVIARIRAINIWKQLTNIPEDEASFEQGLAALSAFFGADIDKISEELDRLAENCRTYLLCTGLSNAASQTEVTIAICTWMRQEGFVKSDLVNFHNLLNHFPHSVLFGQPRTLPISLVYVFVCVARRLGLNASPVAFPYKVLAVVLPPADQPGEAIYVDVFDSATHPILSYSEDLPAMLQQLGIDLVTLPRQTAPASTATMVLRAAANIIQSLDRPTARREGGQMAAHYAAYCAALLLTGDQRLVRALFVDGIGGPLDRAVVFKGTLEQSIPEGAQQELNLCVTRANLAEINDSTPRNVSRHGVLYFTGMVFRHKRLRYIGLVKGWDYHCEATAEWIRAMRVDDLPRGSNQPFYRSFTSDGDNRYVAEDNIEPILHPTPSNIRVLLENNSSLGRWFDGVEFDASNSGQFVLSHESRWLYPMDEAVRRAFLAEKTRDQ